MSFSVSSNDPTEKIFFQEHCLKNGDDIHPDDIWSSKKIYQLKFDPQTINQFNLKGCNYCSPHYNYCVEIVFETLDSLPKNDWLKFREKCYKPYIVIGKNKLNKFIHFAPYSEFKFIKKYKDISKQKEIEVYQYLLSPKNNSFMIQKFEEFIKRELINSFSLYENLENNNLNEYLLIQFNSSDNLIEIYILLVFFLSLDKDLDKEQIHNIYKGILSKIDLFLYDKRYDFFTNLLFLNNLVEIMNLEKEIEKFKLRLESFNLIYLIEIKITEIIKTPNFTGNIHYYYLNKLLKRFKNILVNNVKMLSELEYNELYTKLTEMQILTKQKSKMLKEIVEKGLIGDFNSIVKIFVNYQNIFGEDFFSNLTKKYLEVKSVLASNCKSLLIVYKKIEDLTNFTFENYIQIRNFKMNIYLFFHELLTINLSNNFTENSVIIASLIIIFLRKDLREINQEETQTNKEKIYFFSTNYLILMIESHKQEFLKMIMMKVNSYESLKIFQEEIEEIMETCRKKDYKFLERPMKILNFLDTKDEDFPLNNKINKNIKMKLIDSSHFIENFELKSIDLILCNQSSIEETLLPYQKKKLSELIDEPQIFDLDILIVNYLTKGLSKEKLENLKKLEEKKEKSQEEMNSYRRILLELKQCFPNEQTFLHYFRKNK